MKQAQFEAARARVLAARAKRDAILEALRRGYGEPNRPSWWSYSERNRVDRAQATYDRAAARIWKLLEASPRDWRGGVPASWVAEELTYADAVRPLSEPLSVVPPCAYGFSKPLS